MHKSSQTARSARPSRAAVLSVLLGLACGALAIVLLVSLYTGDVFGSAPLRMLCLGEPLLAAGAIISAAIALSPLFAEGFRPGFAAARRSGQSTWLALTGMTVAIIATVCLVVLFAIGIGLE